MRLLMSNLIAESNIWAQVRVNTDESRYRPMRSRWTVEWGWLRDFLVDIQWIYERRVE